MTFALLSPTGHTRILAEQPGGGVAQLKLAPGGVEVNVILVEVPEQIEFVKGIKQRLSLYLARRPYRCVRGGS